MLIMQITRTNQEYIACMFYVIGNGIDFDFLKYKFYISILLNMSMNSGKVYIRCMENIFIYSHIT